MVVSAVHRKFPSARWVCVHRDPIEQFESVVRVAKSISEKQGVPLQIGVQLHTMFRYWACTEHALWNAERLGLYVSHWHMDRFTTLEGFRQLAASLRLELKSDVDLGAGHNDAAKSYTVDEDPGIDKLVMEQFKGFEALPDAYEMARRY